MFRQARLYCNNSYFLYNVQKDDIIDALKMVCIQFTEIQNIYYYRYMLSVIILLT